MVLDDRRMKVREIAETIGISKERVGHILHDELDMKKNHYRDGIMVLEHRWNKCISLRGDKIEK
jgi:predicted XRE-type DNA-binding protein